MPLPKSDVWNFFTLDGKEVICKHCDTSLAYHGTTSTMRSHLNTKHTLLYDGGKKKPKDGLVQTKVSYISATCSSATKDRVTRKIINFIATDLRPLSTVEGKGFIELMETAVAGYSPPSRPYVMTQI